MNTLFQASSPRPARGLRFSLLALLAALQVSPLSAVEIDDAARANKSSSAYAATPWISGGVGDEALAAIRLVAADYNVHVTFSGRQGSYLASVPFTVTRGKDEKLLEGVTAGPMLYIKLAPGSYQVSARIDGVWQSKAAQVAASGPAARLSFVAKGD